MLRALLLENYLIVTSFLSYFAAQLLKTILYSVMNKKLDLKRMVGSGGMPSSHAATVAALATAAIRKCGPTSPITAIALILASIVIYDARGVRQEAGKHAQLLNDLLEAMHGGTEIDPRARFNEMIGHTFFQVIVGTAIGIFIPLVIPVF